MSARTIFLAAQFGNSVDDALSHPGERLITACEWPAIGNHLGLTTRELEVIVLLFHSNTVETISRKLTIKPRTVRQYVEQVHVKLKLTDRIELILRVIEARDAIREAVEKGLRGNRLLPVCETERVVRTSVRRSTIARRHHTSHLGS